MLETLIEENTAALKALTAAMGKRSGAKAAQPAEEPEPAKKPAAKKGVAAKKGAPAGKPTIKSVSTLLLSVADSLGRDVAVKILAKFDAVRVKDVDPDNFPALVKLLKATIAKAKAKADAEADAAAAVPDDDDDFGLGDDDDNPDPGFDDDDIFGDD